MTGDRLAVMRERLETAFHPSSLEITDDSHRHVGHAGARDGRGHFSVAIVASAFTGAKRLERHRMVYAALGTLMQTDIHALSVTALAPNEL